MALGNKSPSRVSRVVGMASPPDKAHVVARTTGVRHDGGVGCCIAPVHTKLPATEPLAGPEPWNGSGARATSSASSTPPERVIISSRPRRPASAGS